MPSTFWELVAQPLATSAAGAGAIGAGLLALHNGEKTRSLEGDHHRQTMDRDRESNLRDRYTTAAEQLGDENSAVREAGAYAIAALADDWLRYEALTPDRALAHSQARTCINLLCSYLRANRHDDDNMDYGFSREEAAVRSSIVGVIRERSRAWMQIEDDWKQSGELIDFAPIKIDLSEAFLVRENFSGADLRSALLAGTDLERSNLRDVNFAGAHLAGVNLKSARMPGTNFTRAHLMRADLSDAFLAGADFTRANAYDAIFQNSRLQSATFRGANLRGAQFGTARRIQDAVFDLLTRADSRTEWPEEFDFEEARSSEQPPEEASAVALKETHDRRPHSTVDHTPLTSDSRSEH